MNDLKQAVLLIRDDNNLIKRVLVFDDHNDALDVFFGQDKSIRSEIVAVEPEHFKQGEKPKDIPLQKKLI